MFDYDGGHWHGEDRQRDEPKSLEAVKNHKNAVVVRARIGAAPLSIGHERIHVLPLSKGATAPEVADAVLQAVEIDATTNLHVAEEAEALLHAVLSHANAIDKAAYDRLLVFAQNDVSWVHEMLNINGARPRITTYVTGLERL